MKHRVSDVIYQPSWEKSGSKPSFKCPHCGAPYYDHTEWGGNDDWCFDCDVCKKEIKIHREETIDYIYEIK